VNPSGWTAITDYQSFFNDRYQIHYKLLTSSDPNTVVSGLDGFTGDRKVMLVFSGNIRNITVSSVSSEINAGDPSSKTTLAGSGTAPLIVLGNVTDGDFSSTPTFSTESPAFDDEVGAALRVGYKIYNSSPADHTIDQTDLGSANWISIFYIEVN